MINIYKYVFQLRLDFDTFVITGPTTLSTSFVPVLNGKQVAVLGNGVSGALTGQCLTDSFSVTNAGSSAPTICGTNSGEHSKPSSRIVSQVMV